MRWEEHRLWLREAGFAHVDVVWHEFDHHLLIAFP
jgi:hypothetical protein